MGTQIRQFIEFPKTRKDPAVPLGGLTSILQAIAWPFLECPISNLSHFLLNQFNKNLKSGLSQGGSGPVMWSWYRGLSSRHISIF